MVCFAGFAIFGCFMCFLFSLMFSDYFDVSWCLGIFCGFWGFGFWTFILLI